jgi:hypothetical protein
LFAIHGTSFLWCEMDQGVFRIAYSILFRDA